MYLLEKAVIVKSLTTDFSAHVCAFYFLRHVRSLLNCSSNASGAAKQKGGSPYFFSHPPSRGGAKKKWGAKRKGGARTPRTPPEYASVYAYLFYYISEKVTLTIQE